MPGKSTTSNTTREPGPMHNPPHPGRILKELCLEPLGLSIREAADALGISRTALSQLVNGHSRMSVDMAKRLGAAFGNGTEIWLNLQHNRDLWVARQDHSRPKVRPLVKRKAV